MIIISIKLNVNKNDRRFHRTHTAIRDSALLLAEKYGWNKVNVTKLTEIANINRNTFYLHYETINDVFDEIENEFVDTYREVLNGQNLSETLVDEAFFESFCIFLENGKEIVSKIKKSGRSDYLLFKLHNVWTNYFEISFPEEIEKEKEKTIIIQYLSGGMNTLFSSWIKNPDTFDVRKYFFYEAEIIRKLMKISEI